MLTPFKLPILGASSTSAAVLLPLDYRCRNMRQRLGDEVEIPAHLAAIQWQIF
jgi:hypothetical protein